MGFLCVSVFLNKVFSGSCATLYGDELQLQHRGCVHKTKENQLDASRTCMECLTSHLVSVSQTAGPSVPGSVLVTWVALVPQGPLSTGGMACNAIAR